MATKLLARFRRSNRRASRESLPDNSSSYCHASYISRGHEAANYRNGPHAVNAHFDAPCRPCRNCRVLRKWLSVLQAVLRGGLLTVLCCGASVVGWSPLLWGGLLTVPPDRPLLWGGLLSVPRDRPKVSFRAVGQQCGRVGRRRETDHNLFKRARVRSPDHILDHTFEARVLTDP